MLKSMPHTSFERLNVGDEIPPVVRGPMTCAHIMRWSSAIENWHRIHYDRDYAVDHDGLPDILVNGSWKQHLLMEMLTAFAGDTGWLWKIAFQYRKTDARGAVLTAWGRITDKAELDGLGRVGLEIGIRNQDGDESTPGTAMVVLPLTDAGPVACPFLAGDQVETQSRSPK